MARIAQREYTGKKVSSRLAHQHVLASSESFVRLSEQLGVGLGEYSVQRVEKIREPIG